MSRYILVCSSDFAAERYQALVAGGDVKIVAVDAGYSHLRAGGLKPTAIIGDFDSLGHLPYAPGSKVMRFPEERDESDLELALAYVEEQGADEVFVFGALGGRLDQTIATLQVARGFADAFSRLILVSEREIVHVLGPNRTLSLEGSTADYVSVLSAVDVSHGVRIQGFRYPFEGDLTNDRSLG
ncbi:MAG: thiamine diphosphokinase, partial [Eggerthellaceae bacterium]|nr:thiamine diphosphokinase [Eggerthellaceae bacterium]